MLILAFIINIFIKKEKLKNNQNFKLFIFENQTNDKLKKNIAFIFPKTKNIAFILPKTI